jgi:hypothetical protein
MDIIVQTMLDTALKMANDERLSTAQRDCLRGYHDAMQLAIPEMRQQLAEQTSGEPIYQIFELNGCWSDVTLDFYTGCNRDKRIVYLAPQSVEVILEALRGARDLFSSVEGISRNNFEQLASEEIERINDALNAYSSKPQPPVSVHTDSETKKIVP